MAAQFSTRGEKVADWIAATIGSWPFLIGQSAFFAFWILLNIVAVAAQWDPYPFVFLNLVLSFQAAYTGPVIMISQNRQTQRDRAQAEIDYQVNVDSKREIEQLMVTLDRLEQEKLSEILDILRTLVKPPVTVTP